MAIGAAVVALAYASLALVATSVGDGMTSWIWLLLFLVILTFGELWILPVGLELFGRLAPPGYAATTLAAWFFAGDRKEHTSELPSLMRISYADFCLQKQNYLKTT